MDTHHVHNALEAREVGVATPTCGKTSVWTSEGNSPSEWASRRPRIKAGGTTRPGRPHRGRDRRILHRMRGSGEHRNGTVPRGRGLPGK